MKVISASMTGKYHVENNLPCQDIAIHYSDDDFSAIILCDGAGSKEFGLESAEQIAALTLDYLKALEEISTFSQNEFIEYINDSLEENDLFEENAGSTLMFAVCKNKQYLLGHIGDGVIIKHENNNFSVAIAPKNALFANTTYFLPTKSLDKFTVKSGVFSNPFGIIIASDGIAPLLFDVKTMAGTPACKKIIRILHDNQESVAKKILNDNLREVFSKFSSDDLSIAILTT